MSYNKGKTNIFIVITNDCNLNCFSCSHGCNVNKNKWYITLDEFKQTIDSLKNNHVTINGYKDFNFTLIGGEPLLHPQIKEMCFYIKEQFIESTVTISTNGLLLNKVSDKILCEYGIPEGIAFEIPIYPNLGLLNFYQKLIKRCENLNIAHICHLYSTRFYFSKQTIFPKEQLNNNELKDFENWVQHCYQKFQTQGHVVICQDKIYNCWHSMAHANLCPDQFKNNDYLIVSQLTNNQELLPNIPHIDCENCKRGFAVGSEYILWQPAFHLTNDYTNVSLKDIYLNHYDDYYQLIHNCKEHIACLNNTFYKQQFLLGDRDELETKMIKFRFLNESIADIFIPFNGDISINFINDLLKQSIVYQCNLYFVDYSQDKNIQELVYTKTNPANFLSQNIFIYHLKAASLYNAYQVFLNNSYNNKKLMLDINNSQALESVI